MKCTTIRKEVHGKSKGQHGNAKMEKYYAQATKNV